FLDTSTGTVSGWSWDFGDGETSSMQSPMHVYTSPGVYTVNLSVCNDAGCSWISRANYIYAIPSGPAPTETPRYYIKIGGEEAGTTTVSKETETAAEEEAEELPGDRTTIAVPSGTSSGTGSSTGSSSTGSSSSGSGGGQESEGTGSTTGQESQESSPEASQSIPITVIQTLIDALGDVVTTTEELLGYLQSQLHFLFGR
ncbi:MAG: PKD domain-containing protein, partial [Methanomicrobiales archaeon]|nr:PKD domain-containing protein [Methanomicrobiales archaeon]